MRTVIWHGENAQTEFLNVANQDEFVMLLSGDKNSIRSKQRLHRVGVTAPTLVMCVHNEESFAPFVVHKIYRQDLREMTDDDAWKEGFESLDSYKDFWMVNTQNLWQPYLTVWVYELSSFDPENNDAFSQLAMKELALKLYPIDL